MKHFIILFFFLFTFQFANAQDGINQWTLDYDNGNRIWAMVINPVNQNIIYAGGIDSGVYKSTNGGLNWFQVNSGMTYFHIQCLAISASNPDILYAGTDSLGGWATSGVYKTTNGGGNWTIVSAGITDSKGIQAIVIHPTNPNIVYVGVFNALAASQTGLWKTTDGGTTWFASSTGMTNKNMLSLVMNPLNPNVLYAGSSLIMPGSTGPVTIYKTYDAGANWTAVINGIPQTSTDNNPIRCLSISSLDTSVVLAALFMNAATGGMYLTTNGGQLWSLRHTGIPTAVGTLIRACIIKPGSATEMYAGLDRSTFLDMGVFRTTNAGVSWTAFSGGSVPNTTTIRALVFKITPGLHTLFAGCASTSTPRGIHDYSWVVSGISNNGGNPDNYALSQNYPNPFNPVTKINFSLKKTGFTSLKIYNLLGQEVVTLVNEIIPAGNYSIDFNGSNFSSGTYFYKIQSGEFADTKKMILVK
jgi:hypothetical protein